MAAHRRYFIVFFTIHHLKLHSNNKNTTLKTFKQYRINMAKVNKGRSAYLYLSTFT